MYKTLAVKGITTWFANRDYSFGADVIGSAMVIWASAIVGCPVTNMDRPTFTIAAGRQPELRQIIEAWSKSYWAYLTQIENEKVERLPPPMSSHESSDSAIRATRDEVVGILEKLTVEEGIQFMATLTAEWARRFNVEGFLQLLHELGHLPRPESIEDGSYAAVAALRFMDIDFQIA